MDEQYFKKLINICSQPGNAILKYFEVPSYTSENGQGRKRKKKKRKNRCWPRSGERETFIHCWWEYKFMQSIWKSAGKFLTKLEIDCHRIQLYNLYIYQIESVSTTERLAHLCLLFFYSQRPGNGNSLHIYQQGNI